MWIRCEKMVGMTGLEPATPTPPAWCATRLRYIPTYMKKCIVITFGYKKI